MPQDDDDKRAISNLVEYQGLVIVWNVNINWEF